MITISHRKLVAGGGLTSLLIAAAAVLLVAFAGVRLVGLTRTPFSRAAWSRISRCSLVYVKAVDPLDVESGRRHHVQPASGTLVTHQVYQIDAESRAFRTQGIANIASDGSISPDAAPVPYENLVGKPVACIPYLGYINKFLTSPLGLVIAGTAIAVFIIASIAAGKLAALDSGQAASHRGGGGKHSRCA